MVTRILRAERLVIANPPPATRTTEGPEHSAARICYWRGASGEKHLFTMYSLIDCPPLPQSAYILVTRDEDGHRTAAHVGVASEDAPTLNLAAIRQRGAQLGVNEVHVHFLAASDEARMLVACDLRAQLFGSLASEPVPVEQDPPVRTERPLRKRVGVRDARDPLPL
jgi:hypothetical protein